MGTRGYRAYRYKYRYYRLYTHYNSYPDGDGQRFASLIPRDAATREVWIKHIIRGLEAGQAWRRRNNIADKTKHLTQKHEDGPGVTIFQDEEPKFEDIMDGNEWLKGIPWIEWTYVIDLDCRAFTVNSMVHFNLDNMPLCPGFDDYFTQEDEGLLIPQKYLTTVSYWPCVTSDLPASPDEYCALKPALVGLEAWGVSSWSSLSVAQRLSVQLIETLISDYGEVLTMSELPSEHSKILLILWQLVCAAAPSHVLCPTRAAPQSENITAALAHSHLRAGHLDLRNKAAIPHRLSAEDFVLSYYWFRGCLITFCTWLHKEQHARVEIGRMAKQLRKNNREHGVGIIISAFEVVAVSVNGSKVCHSPVLDFHNGKGDVRDGLLLLMHLLSPTLAVRKVPWARASTTRRSTSSALPEEIIQQILCFTDEDTYYFVLPIVSRLIRSICLGRPRVGNFVLTAANADGTYRALSVVGLAAEKHVELVRISDKLDAGLPYTFQHYQVGGGTHSTSIVDEPDPETEGCLWAFPDELSWGTALKGEYRAMRVQVVEGKWDMVEVDMASGEVPSR
ncbi:hypothetical protein FS749_001844 [Ceratobasidium sp. UAMH 11750]|nr:hypothetical protein FS749_001844 [Ceratobasidium sp. UAMH 11750]